jgi:hypothetical protein
MNAATFGWDRNRPSWREFLASVGARWLAIRLGLFFAAGAGFGVVLALTDIGTDVLFAILLTALVSVGALAVLTMTARRWRESRILSLERQLARFETASRAEFESPAELQKALTDLRHAVHRIIVEYPHDWPDSPPSIALGTSVDSRADVDVAEVDPEAREMYWAALVLYRSALVDLIEARLETRQRFEKQQLSLTHDD